MEPVHFRGIVRLTKRIPAVQKILVWNCSNPDNPESRHELRFILTDILKDRINGQFDKSCDGIVYIWFPEPEVLQAMSAPDEEIAEYLETMYNESLPVQLEFINKIEKHQLKKEGRLGRLDKSDFDEV